MKCFKCNKHIEFLDDAVNVQRGRMGGEDSNPFITYAKNTGKKIDERFFHLRCFEGGFNNSEYYQGE